MADPNKNKRPGSETVSFVEDRPADAPTEVAKPSRRVLNQDQDISENQSTARTAIATAARGAARAEKALSEPTSYDRIKGPGEPPPSMYGDGNLYGQVAKNASEAATALEGGPPDTTVDTTSGSALEISGLQGMQDVLDAGQLALSRNEAIRDNPRLSGNPMVLLEDAMLDMGVRPLEKIRPAMSTGNPLVALFDPLLAIIGMDSYNRDYRRYLVEAMELGYAQQDYDRQRAHQMDLANIRTSAHNYERMRVQDDLAIAAQAGSVMSAAITSSLASGSQEFSQNFANAQMTRDQWNAQLSSLNQFVSVMDAITQSRSENWRNTLMGQQFVLSTEQAKDQVRNLQENWLRSYTQQTLEGTSVLSTLLQLQQEYGSLTNTQLEGLITGMMTEDYDLIADSLPPEVPLSKLKDLSGVIATLARMREVNRATAAGELDEYNKARDRRIKYQQDSSKFYKADVQSKVVEWSTNPSNMWGKVQAETAASLVAGYAGFVDDLIDNPDLRLYLNDFDVDENGKMVWDGAKWRTFTQAVHDWMNETGWSSASLPTEMYAEQTDGDFIAWKFSKATDIVKKKLEDLEVRIFSGNADAGDPFMLDIRPNIVNTVDQALDVDAIEDPELRAALSSDGTQRKAAVLTAQVDDLFRNNVIGRDPFGTFRSDSAFDNVKKFGGDWKLALEDDLRTGMSKTIAELRSVMRSQSLPSLEEDVQGAIDDTQLTNLIMAIARETGAWEDYQQWIDKSIYRAQAVGPAAYGLTWEDIGDIRESRMDRMGGTYRRKKPETQVDEHIGLYLEEVATGRNIR